MSRRPRLLGFIIAIGLVLVGAVGAIILDRSGEGAGTGSAGGEIVTFVTPTGAAEIIDPARISVTATSHLPPAGAITYDPVNTIDGDPLTAWNSDSPDADGRGETLTFRFAEPVDLKAIRFMNGYAKNDEIFAANHRLRSVVVHTDESSRPLTLLDTGDPQEITFDFGLTSKVVLEVVDVYAGSGFADPELTADLAVSEVSFLAVHR